MRLPMLKPGQQPTLRPDGAIWLGSRVYGLATELKDASGLVWPLCALLDGTHTVPELVARMDAAHGATQAQVRAILDLLLDHGWLLDAAAVPPPSLAPADIERHSRTLAFLADIDETPRPNRYELLAVLRASSVAVLGLGGVGSAVAASLAATGIGRLHLVDFDLVASSNLNRQLLYNEADIGRAKARAAAERLGALDPRTRITAEHRRIEGPADVAAAIADADLVFCCADRPADVYDWVNEACFAAGTPWLVAGYSGALVTTATLIPGRTCCYACINTPQRRLKAERGQQAELDDDPDFHPVIAASAQISGHQLALEGIRLLLGMPVQSAGRELHRNLLDFAYFFAFDGVPRADCPIGCAPAAVPAAAA